MNKELQETLAKNIRNRAQKQKISLNQLADLAGVSRSQLFNVLAGDSGTTVGWIDRLAKALDTEAWKLIKPTKSK